MPDRSDQVLRVPSSNRTVFLVIAAAVVFLMICVVSVVLSRHLPNEVVVTVCAVVFTAGLVWLMVRAANQSIRLDGSDVVLRGVVSSLRIPREIITGADFYRLDPNTPGVGGVRYIPRLLLVEGSPVALQALAADNSIDVVNSLGRLRHFLDLPRNDPPPLPRTGG